MSNENFEHFGKLSSQLDFIWQLSDYIRRYLNIVEIAERYSGGSENKNRLYFWFRSQTKAATATMDF